MLEMDDIQGLLFSGYGSQRSAMYLFFSLHDTAKARIWLGELVPHVITGGSPRDRAHSLNLAFTYNGFEQLGLSKETLATFSRA